MKEGFIKTIKKCYPKSFSRNNTRYPKNQLLAKPFMNCGSKCKFKYIICGDVIFGIDKFRDHKYEKHSIDD